MAYRRSSRGRRSYGGSRRRRATKVKRKYYVSRGGYRL